MKQFHSVQYFSCDRYHTLYFHLHFNNVSPKPLSLGVHHCPSLWAGTNAGHIYVCYLTIPEGEKRSEEEVQVEIGKEIKLKHKAPVVSMFVVDKDGMPLLGDVMEDKDKGKFQGFIFQWRRQGG